MTRCDIVGNKKIVLGQIGITLFNANPTLFQESSDVDELNLLRRYEIPRSRGRVPFLFDIFSPRL